MLGIVLHQSNNPSYLDQSLNNRKRCFLGTHTPRPLPLRFFCASCCSFPSPIPNSIWARDTKKSSLRIRESGRMKEGNDTFRICITSCSFGISWSRSRGFSATLCGTIVCTAFSSLPFSGTDQFGGRGSCRRFV